MSAYAELEARFAKLSHLGGALALLSWDRAVLMPKGAIDTRAEQIATLQMMAHDILTDPRTGDLLEEAQAEPLDDAWRAANLHEIERSYRRATAIPADLVGALARATAKSEMAWRGARTEANFGLFANEFKEVVRLTRESAAAKGEILGLEPYDALLDDYQKGVHRSRIDPIFTTLARELPGRIERILARQAPPVRPARTYPAAAQRLLAEKLMRALGFDFERGRLDESVHPFCSGSPDDIRMTTRWDEKDVASGLMGVLHETGHALYEAGLPKAWRHQPVGRAGGMAAHESQSLIVEMQACRSPGFVRYLASELDEAFGPEPAFTPENLIRLYHHVERGFIRVDADEATYPLHIVLRYRLEPVLLSGELAIDDLPGAWNEQMRDLLGVVPHDDAQGCLQDIHWPMGAFGYFPSYTLGALGAAQLFAAAERAMPDLQESFEVGDFAPLVDWLRQNVHGRARSIPFDQLMTEATGGPLGADAFLEHLDRRYLWD